MVPGRLVILVPIAEHKTYALPSLLDSILKLTLPHDHCFFFHVNRSKPAFAEHLRLELLRRDIPFAMVFNDKDYASETTLLRERNGNVLDDPGAIAALLAIAEAREALLRGALMVKPERIFWLDADMVPPPDTVSRLMAHNKDVVSAKCFMRRADIPTVCAWRYDPALLLAGRNQGRGPIDLTLEELGGKPGVTWLRGKTDLLQLTQRFIPEDSTGLQEVDGVGLAATLWSAEAAKKVIFHLQNLTSDDMLASSLLQEAGFPIFVDMDLHVLHMDSARGAV